MTMSAPIQLPDLQQRFESGERFVFRQFYGHTARADGKLSNAVFSQFYPSEFRVDGQLYRWCEQWMMAGKARLFGDPEVCAAILAADTPQQCKQLGRQVRGFDETRWGAARFDLVTRGNLEKFSQNGALKAYLLGTGDEILVEAARNDNVWGTGLDRDHPHANNPVNWPGLNLLGFALIRVRGILRGELPPPDGFELK